jgi:hypothetical protein
MDEIAWLARTLRSCGVLLGLATVSFCQTPQSALSEYDVKAAYLLNFTKFVDWPSRSLEPFTICIVGDDPFGGSLTQILEGEQVNGRRIAVRHVSQPSRSCEVVFISKSEGSVGRTLAEVPAGVLTVGEGNEFLRRGGMIAFVLDNRRVRFDVNQRAIEKGGVRVSSRLLNVARVVER